MKDDETRIDSLEKKLYSREQEGLETRERRDLHEQDFELSEEWKQEEMTKSKHKLPLLKLILIISTVFFIGAAALSSFFFFKVPAISPNNVLIEIEGPATISGGDELSLQITLINKNPVALDAVDLLIEYPDGTRSATDINVELPRYREALGSIVPGERVKRTVSAVLFGEENSIKDIKIVVEFRVTSSNAIFFAEKLYQVSLATPPLSLVVDVLKEAVSGQEVEITATITSNSKELIKDALLQLEYPFGFEFVSAVPRPAFADRLWRLGDIPPEGKKSIIIRGILSGQDGEERIFRFATGIQSKNDPNTLGAAFINISESVFVKHPFIAVDFTLNGDSSSEVIVRTGQRVRGVITWTNNLPTQIFDGEIELVFRGDILDKLSLEVEDGFYQSSSNKIVWTRQTTSKLASIPAGNRDSVTFSFSPLNLSSGIPFRNPEILIDVSVGGKRLSDTQVPEFINSTLAREIKVSSDLILSSQALYATGPFNNTGSIPPKAEQETTYTIEWIMTNSSNQITDTQVVATLPPYVEWVGFISPPQEILDYNPIGGTITWRLGDVSPGTGSATQARRVAFQVKLLPSLSQVGGPVILVNEQSITGFDRFIGETVSSTRRPQNTELNDPGFNQPDAVVTP